MKKFVVLLCALCCLVMLSVGPANAASWRLGHGRPVDSLLDKDMKAFAAEVEKQTEGRVKIKVYPAGQLGMNEQMMERVSMGSIEMVAGYPNTQLEPKLDIYCLPGLAKSYGDLRKIFVTGSPYMKLLAEGFDNLDTHVLGSYMTAALVGMSFKTDPRGVPDFNAKNPGKIRVPGINAFRYTAEAVGYLTTPLPWAEVFTALQTGVIDGVYGAAAEPTYLQLRDVIKAYLALNIQADMFFLLVNKDIFNRLPEKDRAIVSKIASDLEKSRFAKAEQEQALWEKRLSEAGIKVYRPSAEQSTQLQKKIQKEVWPKIAQQFDKAYFDRAMKAWSDSMK